MDDIRIVINPTTFRNDKDALCVAYNEAFRVIMEIEGYEPQAEPTENQRRFFDDTPYAEDEVQMRRTILARICTFDTSIDDPTELQLLEAERFLAEVLRTEYPQTEEERDNVTRILNMLRSKLSDAKAPPPPEEVTQENEEAPQEEELTREASEDQGPSELSEDSASPSQPSPDVS